MQKITHNQQSGAVSMITVIFLALLLSIITISFIRLSITEQRQAIDDDLSSRAFYAAESGIEDAKRALELRLSSPSQIPDEDLNANTCEPANNTALDIDLDANNYAVLSSDLATAYTCQMINLHPSDFQAELNEWDSITIPLDGDGTYNQVVIEWHNEDDGSATPNTDVGDLKTKSAWSAENHPAMLRARIFSTPTGDFSRSNITSNVAFLNPGSVASPTYTYLNNFDGNVRNAGCNNDGYKCKVTINGLNSGNKNYLRLMSIYRGAHIKVSLFNSSSSVKIQNVQAIVDVTGKAGDVYRRVEARLSLLDNGYPFPDFALWSNDEICKDFRITNDVNEFIGVNQGTCTWANP